MTTFDIAIGYDLSLRHARRIMAPYHNEAKVLKETLGNNSVHYSYDYPQRLVERVMKQRGY